MNYRRGLQRFYLVLTLAWVIVLSVALPADRLNFWSASQRQNPATLPADWFEANKPESGQRAKDYDALAKKYGRTVEPPSDSFVPDVAAPLSTPSRASRALWLARVLLLPPAFGYVTVFLVIPWVYRGFRSGTQI